MAFYRDLEPCDYFRGGASVLRAVGWLSAGHDYSHGELHDLDYQRLKGFVEDCWQPFWYRGSHTCEFCQGCRGTRNLFVPGTGVVFVAPEMIVHYVERHSYAPPREFLDALSACPEMGTSEYFSRLIDEGGTEFGLLTRLAAPNLPVCPFCGGALVTP
jgi:hypothetical protein